MENRNHTLSYYTFINNYTHKQTDTHINNQTSKEAGSLGFFNCYKSEKGHHSKGKIFICIVF